MNINQAKFNEVVASAKAKAAGHPAWVRAIDKAADVLLNNPYVEILDNGDVLMVSETSSQLYTVNGKCAGENGQPCKGYQFNKGVCYHRALKQLAVRYREAETAPTAVSDAEVEAAFAAKFPGYHIADYLLKFYGQNSFQFMNRELVADIHALILAA
jgi:hypothetical protein